MDFRFSCIAHRDFQISVEVIIIIFFLSSGLFADLGVVKYAVAKMYQTMNNKLHVHLLCTRIVICLWDWLGVNYAGHVTRCLETVKFQANHSQLGFQQHKHSYN